MTFSQGAKLDTYFSTPDTEWYKQRLTVASYAVFAAFVLLLFRLFYLQVIQGQEYKRLSENNCIRLQSISPSRGLIFDRNGFLLVDNRPSFNLYITLKDAGDLEQTIGRLSVYTGMPEDFFQEKISKARRVPSYKPLLLMQDIGRDMLARVEVHQFDLPGVSIGVKPRREYIYPKSAAHLLGYLGEINAEELASGRYEGRQSGDFIGKFGVEKSFEQYLRGHSGGRQVEVNASGQVIRVIQTVNAIPGDNIYLTLDQKLQRETEALFEEKVGAAVAMDPNTGEILAMVSSPSFDPNLFVNKMSPAEWKLLESDARRPMENKAIQAEYPPASTYKIVTAIAGLQEGIIDKDFSLFCTGTYQFGNRNFRDWKLSGHGEVSVVDAIAQSCDVFFYHVGYKVGVDRLAWYARGCGLGDITGINLDHEGRGLVPTTTWKEKNRGRRWQAGETLSVAIGQGANLATPLQIAVMMSAVANGGERFRPAIVSKIISPDGDAVFEGTPEKTGALPVDSQNLDIVRQGLYQTVNSPVGTARRVAIEGVHVSGKTGTAQVVGRPTKGQGSDGDEPYYLKPHAWFIAYAPSESPEIAVAVFVEHGVSGSSAAAPIAREMIRQYLVGAVDDFTKKDLPTDNRVQETEIPAHRG